MVMSDIVAGATALLAEPTVDTIVLLFAVVFVVGTVVGLLRRRR